MSKAPRHRAPGPGARARLRRVGLAAALAGSAAASGAAADVSAPCRADAWLVAFGVAALAACLGSEWHRRAAALEERRRSDERLRAHEHAAHRLHDALVQGTQGLVLNLQVVAGEMAPVDPRRQRLETLLDQADDIIAQARDRIHELRTTCADVADLLASISTLGEDLARRDARRFALRVDGPLPPLAPRTATDLYLIAREAMSNAFRHSRGDRVEVDVRHRGGTLTLAVKDNGRGIAPDASGGRPDPAHRGLDDMRERAARLHATLRIDSPPRHGAHVTLALPLRRGLRQRAREIVDRCRRQLRTRLGGPPGDQDPLP